MYPAALIGVSGTINWFAICKDVTGLHGAMTDLKKDLKEVALNVKNYKLNDKQTKCDIKDINKDIKEVNKDIKNLLKKQTEFERVAMELLAEVKKCSQEQSKDDE